MSTVARSKRVPAALLWTPETNSCSSLRHQEQPDDSSPSQDTHPPHAASTAINTGTAGTQYDASQS